jgi:tight adherence protein C
MEIFLALAVFGFVGVLTYFLFASRTPVSEEAIQKRLENIAARPAAPKAIRIESAGESTFWEDVANFFLGDKEMSAKYSKTGKLLHQAGYRGNRAVRIYWGVRIFAGLALAFGGLFLSFLSGSAISDVLIMAGLGGAVGYALPFVNVYRKAKRRVLQMKETLPDTLDLLVVCVEAGMGMDAALNRVGHEQAGQRLAIGEEIALACQEIQAGAPRKESLTRLAERMGVDEFRNLITFLVQTEDLGGSVARALRVFAATMRDKRSKAAEEAARKTVIKLIFPLVFFILPAIFIMVLGPAGLKIMEILSSPLG